MLRPSMARRGSASNLADAAAMEEQRRNELDDFTEKDEPIEAQDTFAFLLVSSVNLCVCMSSIHRSAV